jgi:hypothetical protein
MGTEPRAKQRATAPAEDLVAEVRVPDVAPVLYPQAARALFRIVVHMARGQVGTDADRQSKGRAS